MKLRCRVPASSAHAEIVLGQCEVVEPDVAVTRGRQALDRHLQQREALGGIGQFTLVDLPLRLEHLRHVRVAVDRDAIRPRLQRWCRACVQKSRERLARQAVDEVDIDRTKSGAAARVDGAQGFLDTLLAVDRQLHGAIEVLHAEAGAIETHGRVGGDVAVAHAARIELDGKVASRRRREVKEAARDSSTRPASAGASRKFGVPPPKCSCTTSRSRSNSGATISASRTSRSAYGAPRRTSRVMMRLQPQ